MRKFITTSLILLVTIFTLSISVYAVFLFPGFASTEIKIDVNDQNWDSNKSKYNESNTFKVRFIPQPYLADKNTLVSVNDDTKGYFLDNGVKNYNYKDVVVRNNISEEIFNQVGLPKCNKTKDNNLVYSFVGWTFSKESATKLGYGGSGDYNLITHKSSLNHIDDYNLDGTDVNDNIINLYALYDQGDNDISLNKDKHSLVNLVIDGKYSPFSKLPIADLTYDKRYDYFMNFKTSRLFMNRGIKITNHSLVEGIKVRDNNDKLLTLNDFSFKDLTIKDSVSSYVPNLDLFKANGFYNVYYLDITTHEKYTEDFFDAVFDTRNIIARYFGINNIDTTNSIYSWILIEEIPEFDFLGAYTYSYDMYSEMDNFLTNPVLNIRDDQSYHLNNVRLFRDVTTNDYNKTSYNFNYKGTNNKFNLTTFTVIPKTNKSSSFKVLPVAPKAETGGVMHGYLKPEVATNNDYQINSQELKALDNNILKATETGVYDLDLKIKPGFNSNGEYELTVEVTLKYKKHEVFVVIFQNKKDIVIENNHVSLTKSKKPLYVSAIDCLNMTHLNPTGHRPCKIGYKISNGNYIDILNKKVVYFYEISPKLTSLYNYENDYKFDYTKTNISTNLILYINK